MSLTYGFATCHPFWYFLFTMQCVAEPGCYSAVHGFFLNPVSLCTICSQGFPIQDFSAHLTFISLCFFSAPHMPLQNILLSSASGKRYPVLESPFRFCYIFFWSVWNKSDTSYWLILCSHFFIVVSHLINHPFSIPIPSSASACLSLARIAQHPIRSGSDPFCCQPNNSCFISLSPSLMQRQSRDSLRRQPHLVIKTLSGSGI